MGSDFAGDSYVERSSEYMIYRSTQPAHRAADPATECCAIVLAS